MSENNLNKTNEPDYTEEYDSKDNLRNILSESFLLNNDIFSSEFDDGTEDTEIEQVEVQNDEGSKDLSDLVNHENEAHLEDTAFILSIEENIEETNIHRVKREFNEYMREFPKKRPKVKRTKTIVLQEKHESFKYATQTKLKMDKPDQIKYKSHSDDLKVNLKMDKPKQEYGPIKKIKTAKFEIRYGVDVIREPINTKVPKITKDKNMQFDNSEINFRRVHHRKTSCVEFSMEISGNEKNKFSMDLYQKENVQVLVKNNSEVMCIGFDEREKMSEKMKNNLKIGVL